MNEYAAEIAAAAAETTAAENARKKSTVALLAVAAIAYAGADWLAVRALLADDWDDIWEGLACPIDLARQRRELLWQVDLATGNRGGGGKPWAPAPTRPAVDLHCPDCRRECATVSGHLLAYPECRAMVGALGYATTGGSIGADFLIDLHKPYPVNSKPVDLPGVSQVAIGNSKPGKPDKVNDGRGNQGNANGWQVNRLAGQGQRQRRLI